MVVVSHNAITIVNHVKGVFIERMTITTITNHNLIASGTIGAKGSCVIPTSLSSNAIWLHKFLFGDENYVPSETLEAYSSVIYSDTSKYVGY